MLVFSHRGRAGRAADRIDPANRPPDNTLAAFERAAAVGVDGIETDVRLSREGEAVLFHDRHAPNGREVAALSRAELSAAAGYPVPTLDEALDLLPGLLWNVEIKAPAALARTLAVVGQRAAAGRRFLVTSFWHSLIDPFTRFPGVESGFLFASRPTGFEAFSIHFPHDGRIWSAVWHFEVLDPDLLDQIAALGIRNYVYGVESPDEHRLCQTLPLAGVITDHPELLLPGPGKGM
ncbi:MAG TPA: glycerophosphodiester phosphodiesterase [Thermoanaerobaculia bacterium]|nr:glycerophosphodiester phosphodiesterase [Thermoanaerobaculia bacterium]